MVYYPFFIIVGTPITESGLYIENLGDRSSYIFIKNYAMTVSTENVTPSRNQGK
jgi:hypothetical protein